MKTDTIEITPTKIEQLQAIFTEAPRKVKNLANRLYGSTHNPISLVEAFSQKDIEPHQITRIEETIHKAINLYISNVNTLLLKLHSIDDEAA